VRRAFSVLLLVVLAACSGGDDDDDAAPTDDATSTTAPLHADDDLTAGTHFGLVTTLDPARSRLVFDRAVLLDGQEAIAAAADDEGTLTEGGSYVRNPDDRMNRIPVGDEVVIRLIADQCCELEEVSFEQWLAGFDPSDRQFYGTASSYYEITIDDAGEVVAIDEVIVD
jgi:hypothetical protein